MDRTADGSMRPRYLIYDVMQFEVSDICDIIHCTRLSI